MKIHEASDAHVQCILVSCSSMAPEGIVERQTCDSSSEAELPDGNEVRKKRIVIVRIA